MVHAAFAYRSSFKKRLLLFVGGVTALVWAVAAYHLWRIYADRIENAEVQARSIALAMDEYVRRSLQAVDLAMRGQAEAVVRLGKLPEDAPAEIERLLRGGDSDFARAFSLAVFDARGYGIAASESGIDRTRSFADRDYFRIHVEKPATGLYVSEPLQGRSFGKRFFALSRRIEGPGGKLLGVIMGSIDAKYIADYFATNAIGARGIITLGHMPTRRAIARVPDFEKSFGADIGRSEIFQRLPTSSAGVVAVRTSPVDNQRRIVAYRKVESFPLVIAVGISEDDVAEDVLDLVPVYAGFLLLVSALLAGGAATLLRAWRRIDETVGIAAGMLEAAPSGIALYDAAEGQCLAANQALADLVGGTREELLEQNYHRIASWKASGLYEAALRALETGTPQALTAHFRTTFGREISANGRLVAFDDARRRRLLVMLEDRTVEKQAESDLQLAKQVIDSSNEAILITDAANRIVSVNAAFEAITGYTAAEAVGNNPSLLASGRHDVEFYRAMWHKLLTEGHWEGEVWDRRKGGDIYPKWLRINLLRDPATHAITHHVAVFSDITERKAAEEKIQHLAHHDALTDLPNRFALRVHLEHALARARREGYGVALMFLDLDRFKTINDSLGHHVGDELLREVAVRLRQSVRDADLVARLGGDEFVVVLERMLRADDAAPVARKILETLARPCRLDGHELHTTPSIGIGFYPEDGEDIDTLMRNADAAMYHAKAAGRNNVQYFSAHMNETARTRLGIENALHAALRERQFILHYQPQFDLASGRLTGFEALIRWRHPERGLVPPGEFIPVAEESGMIVDIGNWVLEEACRQARVWQDAGLDFDHIAVNLAARHFARQDLVPAVRGVLYAAGLAPARLELEITETGLMEADAGVLAILEELNGMGVRLVVDDFGTGYSSLAYLKRLPVHRLKIDRSFVMDIETDASDAAIARSVIALAHALSLDVVAEGVETKGQADFLRAYGCDRVQGYLYGRPMPAEDAANLMRR